MRKKFVVVAAVAACLVGAVDAQASYIAYRCGSKICGVNPDGSAQQTLVEGGASPSLSRDGNLLAYVSGNDPYVKNMQTGQTTDLHLSSSFGVAIRPDGGQVAVARVLYDGNAWLTVVNPDGSGYQYLGKSPLSYGWLGNRLLRDGSSNTVHGCSAGSYGNCPATSVCPIEFSTGVCYKNSGASYPYNDINVADDPVRNLYWPSGSPDGTQVLVTAQPYPNDGSGQPLPGPGSIALYNAGTTQLIRDLTTGPNDDQAAWSPDGSMIAFVRSGSIYLMPASGGPGSEHLLVQGDEPSWGGGAGNTLTAPGATTMGGGTTTTAGGTTAGGGTSTTGGTTTTSGGGTTTTGSGTTTSGGETGSGSQPKRKRCHYVKRRIHGHVRRVKVCPRTKVVSHSAVSEVL